MREQTVTVTEAKGSKRAGIWRAMRSGHGHESGGEREHRGRYVLVLSMMACSLDQN